MVKSIQYTINSPEEMIKLGQKLGELCCGGENIYLIGELGAGKTVFVKGLALGLHVPEVITSASFVLVQVYHGRLPLYHIDLYRLDSPLQLEILGLDEIMEECGVVAIEWADLFLTSLAPEYLEVKIIYMGDKRQVVMRGNNGLYCNILERMEQSVNFSL